jgi:hypothetical protein
VRAARDYEGGITAAPRTGWTLPVLSFCYQSTLEEAANA